MKHATIKELNKGSHSALKDKLGLENPMQAPRLVKVVISSGFGSAKDPKRKDVIADRLAKITGQKPAMRAAKKAIASFKTRVGDPIGYQVTMRGARMNDFLDRLIHVALPRTKDFRGLSRDGADAMGNYTLGIKEHTIFPETADEDLKDVFGMSVTLVTTARDKRTALAFLEHLGLPLKREEAPRK